MRRPVALLFLLCLLAGCPARNGESARQTDRTTAPAADTCGHPRSDLVFVENGDFDGDGRADEAFERGGPGELVLGVCLAAGGLYEVEVGQAEGSFDAIDLDADGRSEVIYGGTTVSQQVDCLAVFAPGTWCWSSTALRQGRFPPKAWVRRGMRERRWRRPARAAPGDRPRRGTQEDVAEGDLQVGDGPPRAPARRRTTGGWRPGRAGECPGEGLLSAPSTGAQPAPSAGSSATCKCGACP